MDRTERARALLIHTSAPLLRLWSHQIAERGYAVSCATTGPAALLFLDGAPRLDLLFLAVEVPGPPPGELIACAADRWPGVEVVLLDAPRDAPPDVRRVTDLRLAPDPERAPSPTREAALRLALWVLRDARHAGDRTWTPEGEPIIAQCAYCGHARNLSGEWEAVPPGYLVPRGRISHGICRGCMAVQLARLQGDAGP